MAGLDDLLNEGSDLKQPKLDAAVGTTPNADLMAEARLSLSGNWGMAIVGYILYFILATCVTVFTFSAVLFVAAISATSGANFEAAIHSVQSVGEIVELLLTGAFMVGFCSFFLMIAQAAEARLECLFTGFKRFWKSFAVYFLYTIFILLWSLLLIIPGIIATFRYAMAFYIIADDETCGPLEAIRRSKEMMVGNKWKFFCLNFRFVGWSFLCLFTFGIGFLWLVPYMQTSFAKFYEDVK
jgi:uncharacterized membrane protein